MKHLNCLLSTSLLVLLLAGCTQMGSMGGDSNVDGYLIKGKINNMSARAPIYLEEITAQTARAIDTATVEADGTFELRGKVAQQSLGRLRVGNGTAMLLIIDNKTMDVTLDVQNPSSFSTTGSLETAQLHSLIKDIQAKQPAEREAYLKVYSDTVKNPLLAYMAVSNLSIEDNYESYQKFAQRLQTELPNSPLTSQFQNYIASMQSAMNIAVGKEAPDLKLANPAGKEIALSSLRGKVVLIDFWASWCRPCRQENPNVVAAYQKFKDKGFDIYSVSLDQKADKWKEAIEADKLIWASHVSDLGGWNSAAAAQYSVRSIPSSFLIDKDGKIIAKNLRGEALDAKLAEVLGS